MSNISANGRRLKAAAGNIIPLSKKICSVINATIKPRNFQSFPYNVYITDPNVTAIRGVSNGATISPRGKIADWISIDSTDSKVTFLDGAYCVYTENIFSSRDYTKLTIANSNNGVEVSTDDDLIKTISNLADGYEITIESGINVGGKINFETSGNGVIVVKTTANTGKYSLDADSDEWQYQRYSINGGNDFTFVFGENGSVVGMENFDGMLQSNDTSLIRGEWVTLDGGKFQYTGNASNDSSKSATFTVSGDSITSTDDLIVTHNVYFETEGGNRITVAGLSGNVSVDDIELGLGDDTSYSAHFMETANGIQNNIALMEVSDGASVGNNYSIGVDDSTALIQFSDGEHVISTGSDFTTINADNSGNGFTLNIDDEQFSTISGLSSGYGISINAGGNIGDSLAIHSDGGQGTISVQSGEVSETFEVSGDSEFGLKFNDDSVELINYESWRTIGDSVYNYTSDSLDFTLEGSDINWDMFRIGKKVVPLGDDAYQIALASIGGSVKVNGVDMGIYNDDKYTIHVYVYPDTAVTADIATNISDGASVEGSYDTLIIDDNAKVHISDGKRIVVMGMHYVNKDFTSIDVENGGNGFYLQSLNDKFTTFAGLSSGFNISIEPGGNIGDEVTFKTDGGNGTIAIGNTTLTVNGDENFAIKLDDTGNIAGLKNFSGAATLLGNETFDNDIASALQKSVISFETDESDSVATLTNGANDSLNVYYTNNTTGSVIDLHNETLTNAVLIGQGELTTLIASEGDDILIGNATTLIQTGGAGKDTFRGGAPLESVLITDYTEGEDVIYHGRPFSEFGINGSIEGSDYVFAANGRTITVQDGATKVIEGIDVNGESRFFGKYLTLDDNDPATVTAQDGVATIDATNRTEDIVINGNDGNNTIISSSGNCTLYGGDDSDLFVYNSGNDVITDYTEGDKISLGAAVSSSLIIDAGTLTIQNAKGKTLNLIDSSGKESPIKASSATQIISEVTAQTNNIESVSAGATGTKDITLSNGAAAIIAETSAEVDITASTGNDTIISQGENVHVSLTGGDTRIFPLEGRMTLENYDTSTGSGFGTTYTNIFTPVANGAIDFNNGYLNLDSAQVYMGKSSELMNFYSIAGKQQKVGYASQNDLLDVSNDTADLVLFAKKKSTLTGGAGNDTIFAAERSFIDAGAGSNLVSVSNDGRVNIAFNGNTTLEGFHTGFGRGSDTVYISNVYPAAKIL